MQIYKIFLIVVKNNYNKKINMHDQFFVLPDHAV